MQRYKITIEYDGMDFCGWQRQQDSPSVQATIEEAISKFTREKVTVTASGRTDTGVHALGQIAHFDLAKELDERTIIGAINFHSRPHKLSIIECEKVAETFHARFSAKERHYMYQILNRHGEPILDKYRAWWIRDDINVKAMQIAAQDLIGEHDFTSFRAAGCQAKSPYKTLNSINITKEGEMIKIFISAPSFLYHMVRNITGSLVNVGRGEWQISDIKKALELKDRTKAGVTAPAHGLYFLKTDY